MNNLSRIYAPILTICIAFVLMSGTCKDPEDPEFVKMKDWKVGQVDGGYTEIDCKAVFFNPNPYKLKLKEVEVDVFLEDDKLGIVKESESVKIHKNAGFDVPLTFRFNAKEKITDLIGNLFKFAKNKKVTILYKGHIKVVAYGIPIKVPLEGTEDVEMKDITGGLKL